MKLTYDLVEKRLLECPKSYLDFPFGAKPAVYKIKQDKNQDQDKMFALLFEQNGLMRLSLKCDPLLAETLREKYESVLPGYHLSKKHWNTLILDGQLDWSQVETLIDHSYQLVAA